MNGLELVRTFEALCCFCLLGVTLTVLATSCTSSSMFQKFSLPQYNVAFGSALLSKRSVPKPPKPISHPATIASAHTLHTRVLLFVFGVTRKSSAKCTSFLNNRATNVTPTSLGCACAGTTPSDYLPVSRVNPDACRCSTWPQQDA